ncbi:MAG: hypothetical protein HFG27_00490 [Provencibacterium sp.]|nr:hypothetical protein [Provencibacterium sp.]
MRDAKKVMFDPLTESAGTLPPVNKEDVFRVIINNSKNWQPLNWQIRYCMRIKARGKKQRFLTLFNWIFFAKLQGVERQKEIETAKSENGTKSEPVVCARLPVF